MAIQYNVVKRPNPNDKSSPHKHYVSLVQKDYIDLNYMVDRIAEYSTVNPPDVLAVIESLIRLIPSELANGRSIRLGQLGTFYLTVNAEGADSEQTATGSKIRKVNLRFQSNPRFKEQLGELKFVKVKK